MFQRAQQMVQGKNEQQLQQTVMNLCQQRGLDINQAWQNFQQAMNSGFNNFM